MLTAAVLEPRSRTSLWRALLPRGETIGRGELWQR